MSDYDIIIKQVRSGYNDMPISTSDDIEEVVEALLDLETKFDNQHTQIVELRAQLASAEQSIREGDGMDYFGQRFDRALDRAEAAERQLASARKAMEAVMGCVTADINDYIELHNRGDLTDLGEHAWLAVSNLQKEMERVSKIALSDENSK
jgi:predicted  nucleic acid-binding Zn-ribbon protein